MSTLSILPIHQQRWGCINLCSDSKDLCGTIRHKFTSDTGKSERAGLYQTSAEGGGLAACGHIGQIWRCLKALTKGRWCALPASGHWHDDQTVATTSGNSLLHCLGEKPTQNIFLGKNTQNCTQIFMSWCRADLLLTWPTKGYRLQNSLASEFITKWSH